MSTYRIAAKVSQEGLLELSALPFQPGELVEVTMRSLPVKHGKLHNSAAQNQSMNIRATAMARIQSGKYAKVLNSGERLASDEFAMQKQAEQAQEERHWSA